DASLSSSLGALNAIMLGRVSFPDAARSGQVNVGAGRKGRRIVLVLRHVQPEIRDRRAQEAVELTVAVGVAFGSGIKLSRPVTSDERMPHRPSALIVLVLLCVVASVAGARRVNAEVTRIEFTSKQEYGTFHPGDYVIWRGRIHGDLSPQEAIPG